MRCSFVVTERTLRNDLRRLGELGYRVESRPGRGGGYRLRPGADLAPMLLDEDEAVAVALSLQTAVASPVHDLGETSLRALAKLRAGLPARLRRRVQAVADAVATAPARISAVDPAVLLEVVGSIRDRVVLRADYDDAAGRRSRRNLEPVRLVQVGPRWYLLAWDRDQDDWRTLRADRLHPRTPPGPRFVPREPPDGDAVAHVVSRLGTGAWRHRALVRFAAPLDVAAAVIPPDSGQLDAVDEQTCELRCATDSWYALLVSLAATDLPFTIREPAELAERATRLGARLTDAGRRSPDAT